MEKKYLIITGASKGIGFATAKLFIENHWNVINISRSPCQLEQVINISADLACSDVVSDIKKQIDSIIKSKVIICVVHNAALYNQDTLQSLDIQKLREVLEISLIFPLAINQYLLEKMIVESSIIYIGSTLSEKAIHGAASYVISKHASISMMRVTCQDLVKTGIHTACICPGFTSTEMLTQHLQNKDDIESIINKSCYGRFIEPLEIAKIVLFTANNPVVNGSVLHANLGQIEY
ncbi:SDR family NAD(P)-dependent oxidoreductase [Legionella fairfieldensis]|uniref:SDR family NAD(P)-dependent oxidoreductase n=1 Tax=Legionella fairfieldensis TaxID=45064 RepID=UPI00048D94DD|nr:SDR family oxidoreductase [Legionella fairfieldensis]